MHLHGTVSCNVLADGTQVLPFPFGWRVNAEGVILPDMDEADDRYEVATETLHNWLRVHSRYGEVAFFRLHVLDGRGGYHLFSALDQINADSFAVLRAELQQHGDRQTPAIIAAQLLQDLTSVSEQANFGLAWHLVNAENGKSIQQASNESDGVFFDLGETALGFDANGFFVRQDGQEVFRALQVMQQVLERDWNDVPTRVQYTDSASQVSVVVDAPVSGEMIYWDDGRLQNTWGQFRFEYPTHMRIEQRVIGAEVFDYIFRPLRHLCQVAVTTGNPIVWDVTA